MKIFAHRGYSHKYPEMTREAYLAAAEVGADGFECDVRLTRDLQVVCFHDANTERITGKSRKVSKLSLQEIQAMTEVLTLNELLDISIDKKKDLLIETKHPVKTGGLIEKRVIQALNARSAEIRNSEIDVTVMSFSYLAWRRVSRHYPNHAHVIANPLAAIFTRASRVAVSIHLLRRSPLIFGLLKNKEVYAWTVNSREEFHWAKRRELAGVITNRPKRAMRILRDQRSSS